MTFLMWVDSLEMAERFLRAVRYLGVLGEWRLVCRQYAIFVDDEDSDNLNTLKDLGMSFRRHFKAEEFFHA